MKLKKLFKALRDARPHRRRYRIKWRVRFFIDDRSYTFAFLPTIMFVPWPYRSLGMPILEFVWLNFGIRIGEWDSRNLQRL